MTTLAPTTAPVANRHTAAEAYKAAMARARKAGGRIKRTSDTTWVAESTSCPGQFHEIVKFGPCWHNFRCSCIGASRANAVCLHMALAAASHHYNLPGIRFKTPAAPASTNVVEQAAVVVAASCGTCGSAVLEHQPAGTDGASIFHANTDHCVWSVASIPESPAEIIADSEQFKAEIIAEMAGILPEKRCVLCLQHFHGTAGYCPDCVAIGINRATERAACKAERRAGIDPMLACFN